MTTQTHIIDSGNNGYNMEYPKQADKQRLVVRHSAGFFSCSTIALQDIIILSRELKRLPDEVDRHAQYSWYKNEPVQSLIGHFFLESDNEIDCTEWFELTTDNRELQFTDYKLLNFEKAIQFRDRYFMPSQYILDKVAFLEDKYKIDYENTCGVLYRGNDKARECEIAGYVDFSDCMLNIIIGKSMSRPIQYLMAPDESEFLNYLNKICGWDILCMEETAHMPKKDSCVFLELPLAERAEQAANFFATILMLSKCKYLITHSGNCSLWACLYRGHMNGVSQWLNGEWI